MVCAHILFWASRHDPKCQKILKYRTGLKGSLLTSHFGICLMATRTRPGPSQGSHLPCSRLPPGSCSCCSPTWNALSFLCTCPSTPPPSPAGLPVWLGWGPLHPQSVILHLNRHIIVSLHSLIQANSAEHLPYSGQGAKSGCAPHLPHPLRAGKAQGLAPLLTWGWALSRCEVNP